MDIPYAIQLALEADVKIQSLGVIVNLLEMPEAQDDQMPMKVACIMGGGGTARLGSASLPLNDQRINMLCFGETAHLAWVVSDAVYTVLKNLTPKTWGPTFIHSVRPSVKGTLLYDPDLQWPYVVSSYQVTASDLTMA